MPMKNCTGHQWLSLGSDGAAWRSAFTLVELLVVISLIAIIAALATAAISHVGKQTAAVTCTFNLRQMFMIISRYAADNDGALLPTVAMTDSTSGKEWRVILEDKGYIPKSKWNAKKQALEWGEDIGKIMTCAAREVPSSPAYNGLHYGMNTYPGFDNRPGINDTPRKLVQIKQPSKTVLIGEVDQWYAITPRNEQYRIYPHNNGSNLLFADGHVGFWKGPLPVYPNANPESGLEEAPPFF